MFSADILWREPSSWREVHTALDYHMRRYPTENAALVSLAEAIAGNLQVVDPVMEQLCAATCPSCPDPCCLHADVRYDFRDLVFFHCRQKALPLHQPRLHTGQPCLFLARHGCGLPRTLRPFLCTWYLCPQQMEIIQNTSSRDMSRVLQILRSIQQQRKDLEDAFIHLVLVDENQYPS